MVIHVELLVLYLAKYAKKNAIINVVKKNAIWNVGKYVSNAIIIAKINVSIINAQNYVMKFVINLFAINVAQNT